MSESMITAIATGVPAIIAAITSLIVALRSNGKAKAAAAASKTLAAIQASKTIPESTASDTPGH